MGIGFLTPSQNYEPASLSARYGPLPAPKPGSSPRMHCAHRCSRIGVFHEGNRRCRRPRLNALTVPPEVVNNMGNIADAGLRKAVMKAITPKAPGLEQFLRDTANSLLDNLITEGAPADLRNDFADPLATALHCKVLGIPQEDGPKLFRSLSIAFMSSADPIPAAKINWDRDIEYMAGILENPNITTGLMGELSRLRKDPAYSHVSDELFATIGVTFFGAGVISTGSFLTTALISLIQRPQLRNLLHEKPELIPAGVEELLRINLLRRRVTAPGHRRHPGRRRAGPQGGAGAGAARGRQLRSRALP